MVVTGFIMDTVTISSFATNCISSLKKIRAYDDLQHRGELHDCLTPGLYVSDVKSSNECQLAKQWPSCNLEELYNYMWTQMTDTLTQISTNSKTDLIIKVLSFKDTNANHAW